MIRSSVNNMVESLSRPIVNPFDVYAFRMTFQPGSIPAGLVTTIAGTRYDYLTEADEIAGIETAFPANVPTITWRGLRGCTAYTNYFLNSKTPVTQTITFAAAGTYTCYHYGTGSVTVSGASTGNGATVGTGVGTRSSSVTFTTASAGMTVTFTVAGSVNRVSVNNGPVALPFIPTTSTARASAAETLSHSISAAIHPNFRTQLSSGEIEAKCIASKFVTPPEAPALNIIPTGFFLESRRVGAYDYRVVATDGSGAYSLKDYTSLYDVVNVAKLLMGDPPLAIKTKYGLSGASYYQVNIDGLPSTPLVYDGSLRLSAVSGLGNTYIMSVPGNGVYYLQYLKILKVAKSWA